MIAFQADVIVNSTSTSLDLKNGAVSGSILKRAGPQIQDECKQRYPKGIQVGDIALTKGHGLACKEVFHTALPQWGKGGDEKVLKF